MFMTVTLQGKPLSKEEKLIKHLRFNLLSELFTGARNGCGSTTNQCWFPLIPCDTRVRVLQSAKQSVIIEPLSVALTPVESFT